MILVIEKKDAAGSLIESSSRASDCGKLLDARITDGIFMLHQGVAVGDRPYGFAKYAQGPSISNPIWRRFSFAPPGALAAPDFADDWVAPELGWFGNWRFSDSLPSIPPADGARRQTKSSSYKLRRTCSCIRNVGPGCPPHHLRSSHRACERASAVQRRRRDAGSCEGVAAIDGGGSLKK